MKLTAIILCAFAVVMSVNAKAAAASDMQQHEILFNGTTGALAFGGAPTGGTAPATFNATFGYNYQFMPGFMIGISPTIGYVGSNNGVSSQFNWSFLAGPTVNWPFTDKFDNAFFLSAGIGLAYTPGVTATIGTTTVTTASNTAFQFGFELGKRFEIVEHVVYRPSISLTKTTGTNATSPVIAFNVISFSAAF